MDSWTILLYEWVMVYSGKLILSIIIITLYSEYLFFLACCCNGQIKTTTTTTNTSQHMIRTSEKRIKGQWYLKNQLNFINWNKHINISWIILFEHLLIWLIIMIIIILNDGHQSIDWLISLMNFFLFLQNFWIFWIK